jgi:hypothetical protein
MSTVNSNQPPLGYRIGTSDRVIGGATAAADGFAVLNQLNGKVFIAHLGVWTDGGTMPFPTTSFDFPALYASWYATNQTNLNTDGMLPKLLSDSQGASAGGSGYRIGTSDRAGTTSAPDGFTVLNTTNGNVWVAQSGTWVVGDSFPQDLYNAWLEA